MVKPLEPTQVCLSIDTEFSIAGHFEAPERYTPVSDTMVYGEVDGREEALGFLLETFQRYGTKATFFLECANYFYFGDEPMQSVARHIRSAGQDIQLHVHPVWTHFAEGKIPGNFPRNDMCTGRSLDDLLRIFSLCIEIFERWVGRRPIALRTGSLCADDTIYRALAELNIPLASNVATGIDMPGESHLQLDSGRHRVHGVTEVPVFTYQDMKLGARSHRKSLQITSCSWPEMKFLLRRARAQGVQTIVILTHPSEFIKKSDFRYSKITRNRVNQERLRKLCEFMAQHPQDFVSADFASNLAQWTASEQTQPFIAVPSLFAVTRKLHNKLNDTLWAY